MKLRNKKTGMIGELHFEPDKEYHFTVVTEDPADVMIHKKLAGLYAEWEDYEEPKDFWYIKTNGCIERDNLGVIECDILKEYYDKMVEIGNYFETKEEAEKAVEKLKAWKRLKDKGGFKFTDWYRDVCEVTIEAEIHDDGTMGMINDLDILFGGEE